MKIAVSRHVFGSIRGYTTLAKSKDLSSEETDKLEILSFGQTNESSYLDSLQTNPAYISRPLHSGRWAVTRVFKGSADEHNRITLLFISAVITIDDWLCSLKCDVNKLLYCPRLWQWNGEEKLEPIDITVETKREVTGPEIRNKVLSLLGAVEKYTVEENTTIVVRASDYNAKVHRWLNMVLPLSSKQTFSCATRSLNDGLPLALISMAREGSFGNSKRRTVHWTLTSVVDNCPYAHSLAEFWRPGNQPPWQFIDSCKSFLIDLGGEPQLEQRKRLVTKKPLSAEIAKPIIGRKTYFSRKLAVILFLCAVVAGLATVITIRITRHKEIKSLIAECEKFLSQNSPENSPGKCFPVDENARNNAIEQCKSLRNKAKRLRDQTKEAELQERIEQIIPKLDKWLSSALGAHQRYGLLDTLFQQVGRHNLGKSPSVYPAPKQTESVDELKQSIINVDKAKLAPNCVSQAEKIVRTIVHWRNEIKEIVLRKKDQITDFIDSGSTKIQPHNYSNEQYEKHDGFKQNLEKLKEDETLKNASSSSYEDDKKIATEMINELHTVLVDCNSILENLKRFKEEAESSFNDANDILNDPNITDGRAKNFKILKEAKSHLDNVDRRWPDKPNLEEKVKEVDAKFETNKEKTLRRWKIEKEKIDKERIPDDPNVVKIDELLKEYEEVKTALQKANIQNIDGILQQIKKFDEELRTRSSSISKPKKKESKQNK